jgi:hypothetical protein
MKSIIILESTYNFFKISINNPPHYDKLGLVTILLSHKQLLVVKDIDQTR